MIAKEKIHIFYGKLFSAFDYKTLILLSKVKFKFFIINFMFIATSNYSLAIEIKDSLISKKNDVNFYINENVAFCGLEKSDIGRTENIIYIKNSTSFFVNKNTVHNIKIVNIKSIKSVSSVDKNGKNDLFFLKKKLNTVSISTKNSEIKALPYDLPFSLSVNLKIGKAIVYNILRYKKKYSNFSLTIAKAQFNFQTKYYYEYSLFAFSYNEMAKKYLLVSRYCSRPPPVSFC